MICVFGGLNGDDIWCAHGSERSAGVMTLKNRFAGEIRGFFFFIANVYGYNSKNENNHLFEILEELILQGLSQFPDLCLVIGGDFNTVMDCFIHCLPSRPSYMQNENIKRFMERFNLVDI